MLKNIFQNAKSFFLKRRAYLNSDIHKQNKEKSFTVVTLCILCSRFYKIYSASESSLIKCIGIIVTTFLITLLIESLIMIKVLRKYKVAFIPLFSKTFFLNLNTTVISIPIVVIIQIIIKLLLTYNGILIENFINGIWSCYINTFLFGIWLLKDLNIDMHLIILMLLGMLIYCFFITYFLQTKLFKQNVYVLHNSRHFGETELDVNNKKIRKELLLIKVYLYTFVEMLFIYQLISNNFFDFDIYPIIFLIVMICVMMLGASILAIEDTMGNKNQKIDKN